MAHLARRSRGGRGAIDDHRGPPRRQPGKAHGQPAGQGRAQARFGQHSLKPAVQSAPAAVKARQPAIGMAQRALDKVTDRPTAEATALNAWITNMGGADLFTIGEPRLQRDGLQARIQK